MQRQQVKRRYRQYSDTHTPTGHIFYHKAPTRFLYMHCLLVNGHGIYSLIDVDTYYITVSDGTVLNKAKHSCSIQLTLYMMHKH